MLFGQGLASSSLALQPSHLCNPSLTDLGPVPKNIFLLRAHCKAIYRLCLTFCLGRTMLMSDVCDEIYVKPAVYMVKVPGLYD